MQQITEQQIQTMAPNAAAASNGKKISQKGGFVRLERSSDDTFYMGECTGSGKSNYITSVDFLEPGTPVCRCTCPSRQFPCKHGLALLYEIAAGKSFAVCDIPEDILKKREKKLARGGKTEAAPEESGLTPEETQAAAAKKKASAAKSAKAARTKKLNKQLEGLDLAQKIVRDLMRAGLGTMGGASLKTYEQLSKQLGDYYLPGPQRLINGLILEIGAFQKDNDEAHYENAIDILEKLWTLIKKSKDYLAGKLASEEVTPDDSELYEELGGVWKLSELAAIGRTKQNVELAQLSFWVRFDPARKEYIDTGCWADLSDGRIYMTYNYRPVKALKYVKEEDTVFGVVQAAEAAYYPGEGNLRVRWEGGTVRELTTQELRSLRESAFVSLTEETKAVKNLLKNALADPMYIRLIPYHRIGGSAVGPVLENEAGETIALGDAPGMESTTERLAILPDAGLFRDQVLLGAYFYDREDKRLKVQPLSILTAENVVRLLY